MVDPKLDTSRYDPRSLGLKVGLEIHQQLDTRHKLFCNCPTKLVHGEAEEDIFYRRLRPTRSELGEVDVAALFEWRKGRIYEYHAPLNCSCLVEADEEPPHELNREALVIALAIAKALNSKPVDEIYVMRKIVIDGSNTTGFQRTAIVALGGYIDLPSGKRIGIQTIAVEEDAARKAGEKGTVTSYMLDRMGIPLIEISTAPDITSPEEAYETAHTIGQLLRLSGRVKRGIGTIRQDLNVSIKGGTKIEIKGVQLLDLLPKVVFYEAIRQARLLEIREELRRRGVTEEYIAENAVVKDVTSIFKKTKCKIIRKVIKKGGRVLALRLPGFHGLLGVEVEPGRRFGTELADYARFWGGVGGIFHSDELPAYGISEEELAEVYKELSADKDKDAVVLVADEEKKARKALEAVLDRAKYATKGVPPETRAALSDGTTRYMRPLPGSARMYPETDVPPFEVTEDVLAEAEKIKPVHPMVKLEELTRRYGLSKQLAKQLLHELRLDLFERLAAKYSDKVPATYIASIFTNLLRSLRREGVNIDNITDEDIEAIVKALAEHRIPKEAVEEIIRKAAETPSHDINKIIEEVASRRVSIEEVEKLVDEAVEKLKDEIRAKGMRALSKVMGLVMPKLRGRVEGRVVAEIAKKKIQEVLGG
ncbi:MAG: Glu-tRNA(Gln) amidotransferase subunit GatE [Crenarchaeota archaeon]|nr:Glu-tRNA(Gln) amidotransferase subunit GatE [Thermoproteota archaeon]